MLQQESRCEVADNSGAKVAYVIRVYGGSTGSGKFTRKTASLGDRVLVSVKKALPGSDVKPGDKYKAVVVRTAKQYRRRDGSYVKFDNSAVVLIGEDGNPKGTRIFGPVARELRERNYMKIVSLASEVV
ncbi:MAG: 50S ribosomal protein L14 [Phycisphaeraceae bacterium]|nr:50S ribosomal protein L14 [Phycisphaerales bacterium]MCB9860284.1 50S ribosomal protein L14 [Phycisphaeraceae bacterium]